MKTYASFALAFFFRPAGAALFGRLGDRVGRRPVLITVIVVMSAATTPIGVLPTCAAVGALAPWLLTLLHVVQGLSGGGELGGAVSMTTEFAPPGRRSLYGSCQSFTVALGLLGGAGVAALSATVLSESNSTSVEAGCRSADAAARPRRAVAPAAAPRDSDSPTPPSHPCSRAVPGSSSRKP